MQPHPGEHCPHPQVSVFCILWPYWSSFFEIENKCDEVLVFGDVSPSAAATKVSKNRNTLAFILPGDITGSGNPGVFCLAQ